MRYLIAAIAVALALGPASVQADTSPQSRESGEYQHIDAFPDQNGPLSAMLVVIPGSQLPEFDKPQDQPLHITPLHKATVGDEVAAKVLFGGPQRDGDGNVDVSYDLKVLAPDGTLYDNTDEHGLEALKANVGAGDFVFDNRRVVVGVRFEDKDPAGVYTFVAVLHDNIAKRDIALKTQVELIK